MVILCLWEWQPPIKELAIISHTVLLKTGSCRHMKIFLWDSVVRWKRDPVVRLLLTSLLWCPVWCNSASATRCSHKVNLDGRTDSYVIFYTTWQADRGLRPVWRSVRLGGLAGNPSLCVCTQSPGQMVSWSEVSVQSHVELTLCKPLDLVVV